MAKPVIMATERSPFGDITPEDAQQLAQIGRDRFWLPGYSDRRIKRELDARAHKPVTPLSHRFQLVAVTTVDGKPVAKGVADYRQQGYTPVHEADCKALGIDIRNTSYTVGADGVLLNGDSMLMVTDGKHAAANYLAQRRRNEDLEAAPQVRLQDSAERFNRNVGLTEQTGTAALFEIVKPAD